MSNIMSAFGGKKYIPLVIVLIIGTVLRFYNNTLISLWHDEAFSALVIRYPWGEMFSRLALDVHPPMYYIALRLWHYVFGDGMLSLRGFSILFGVGSVWAGWLFVKEVFESEKMAIWAAVLLAVNPFELEFVTEARMYTFGAFFAIMAAFFLVKALRQQRRFFEDQKLNMPNLPRDIQLKKSFLMNYLGFAVCSSIIALTHYYLLFTIAAVGFYGLLYLRVHYRRNWKEYAPLALSFLLIFLSFLPWLKTFLWQLSSVKQSYWIPDMTWWSIPSTIWTILLGFANDVNKTTTRELLVVSLLLTIFFLWRFMRKTDKFEKWLVLFLVVLPFLGSVAFYLKSISCAHGDTGLSCHGRSVYMDRYFLYAAVFYSMALAVWIGEIKTKWLASSIFVIYVLVNFGAINNYWAGLNISSKPGMDGAAKYLHANVEPGQHIFVGTSFEFFNYKYYQQTYYPTPAPPLLYTGGRSDISQMSSVEGLTLLSNNDLAPTFSQYAHPGDTEWVIWTYAFGSNKPQLPLNWVQVGEEKEFPDVRPYVGTSIYVTEYKVN